MNYYKNKKTGTLISYDPNTQEVQEFELIGGGGREIVEKINNPKKEIRINKKIDTIKAKKKLVDFVLNDKPWSRKYDQCMECGTIEKKHAADGLCQTCLWRKRNKTKSHSSPGLKSSGSKDYICEDCGENFVSGLPKIDVSCPMCHSIHIK